MSSTEQAARRLIMTTPSLTSMADLIDNAVSEPVQFLTSVGENEWALQRSDGSLIPDFIVRKLDQWSFHLLAA